LEEKAGQINVSLCCSDTSQQGHHSVPILQILQEGKLAYLAHHRQRGTKLNLDRLDLIYLCAGNRPGPQDFLVAWQ
jgi:hypothetical protein